MQSLLNQFAPIRLSEMGRVALLKRTDTKYVIHRRDLLKVLEQITTKYRILEIDGLRLMSYKTLYFDTICKKYYNDHHNQRVNRIKVRMREYVQSGTCFLEIKRKDPKGNTIKKRIPIDAIDANLTDEWRTFLKTHGQDPHELSPSIQNHFHRFTLVNEQSKERVTIDLGLGFKHQGERVTFDNLVIIEIKQARATRNSPIVEALKNCNHNPYRLSKYVIGMLSLHRGLKYNRFKCKLLRLRKLGVYHGTA